MTNKQFNEIYRDFDGMAKSKTIQEIAEWLNEHEEFKMIKRDETSISFKNDKFLVCITKGFSNNAILQKKF